MKGIPAHSGVLKLGGLLGAFQAKTFHDSMKKSWNTGTKGSWVTEKGLKCEDQTQPGMWLACIPQKVEDYLEIRDNLQIFSILLLCTFGLTLYSHFGLPMSEAFPFSFTVTNGVFYDCSLQYLPFFCRGKYFTSLGVLFHAYMLSELSHLHRIKG